MAQFIIVAPERLVGILSHEGDTHAFAYYDYRGSAKKPELDAKDHDFCGYAVCTAVPGSSTWTLRVMKRQPPALEVDGVTYRPEGLSYRFGKFPTLLRTLPPSIVFVEQGSLEAFVRACNFSGVAHDVHFYDGEVAVTPLPAKSVAA